MTEITKPRDILRVGEYLGNPFPFAPVTYIGYTAYSNVTTKPYGDSLTNPHEAIPLSIVNVLARR